ncbi:hypothetical protein B4Q04_04535 [Zobellia sp. OII3]|uniref:tetratricopeptide repeat protein n=1 Tax=Zobellia sp. OII3 TaxID=2034520 RepID=UPI000B536032|nr:tetratricopeptide repeat protein [Zobellia sp. OII3]OWW26948.1 hypothetical protein B4Q04_04535 [Zobellia sp. OII3]
MDNDTLINGYFEGSLTESQKKDFDHLLETDVQFAEDFKFQRELQESLKKEERKAVKQMFAAMSASEPKQEAKVISLRPWLVAASIIFLVGIGSWFVFFNTHNYSTDELYNANFVAYENVVHPIERSAELEDLQTRAFTAYENEDYAEALSLFKTLQEKNNDGYIQFYEAITLMQLQKHKEAVPLLENYIEADGELKDRAIWYLALSDLKLGRIDESKIQLQKLVSKNGFKAAAAKRLLEELD